MNDTPKTYDEEKSKDLEMEAREILSDMHKTNEPEEELEEKVYITECEKCGVNLFTEVKSLSFEERETFGCSYKTLRINGKILCPACIIEVFWNEGKSNITLKEVNMDKELVVKENSDLIEPETLNAFGNRVVITLKKVLESKPKKVMIKGEQYLEYEDWQTVGAPFGVSVGTGDAEPIEINGIKGAKAKATTYKNGKLIGGAEAYCMYDEVNWKGKPWYQLASMAQTRAGAKALRNALSWVVVLAGYKTTPAEEMTGVFKNHEEPAQTIDATTDKPQEEKDTRIISEAQGKRLYAIMKESGVPADVMKSYIKEKYNIEHSKDLQRWMYVDVCLFAQEFGPKE